MRPPSSDCRTCFAQDCTMCGPRVQLLYTRIRAGLPFGPPPALKLNAIGRGRRPRFCVRPPSARPVGRGGPATAAACERFEGLHGVCARTNRRTRDESQWIVATRPLCHLQYPVRYLSRLQKIYLPQYAELRCAMVLGLRLSVPSHIGGGRNRRVLAGILT